MPNVFPMYADDKSARQEMWTDPANTMQSLVNDFRVGRRKGSQLVVIYPDTKSNVVCLVQCGMKKKEIKQLLTGILKSLD
jgi:hypothetical protein